MSSRTGHMTTETVYGQTLALQLGDGDEHLPLELDMTGLNVKGNLYLYLLQFNHCTTKFNSILCSTLGAVGAVMTIFPTFSRACLANISFLLLFSKVSEKGISYCFLLRYHQKFNY